MKTGETLPEVIFLHDARGVLGALAAGVGEFWYEPEVWALPMSPAEKVLYAGLCSYLKHGHINRKDLRAALKNSPDEEIAEALKDLVRHGLLKPLDVALPGYAVRSVKSSGS